MKLKLLINGVVKTLNLLFFLFLFSSCDKVIENAHEKNRESLVNINEQIKDSIATSKRNFLGRIAQIKVGNIDSIRFHKIEQMKINLLNTSDFIDSVCVVMEQYDYLETDLEIVKNFFIEKQNGNYLYHKFSLIFQNAYDLSEIKNQIEVNNCERRVFNGFSVDEWNNHFFGMTNPMQCVMILRGFQTELFNACNKSLEGNEKS